MTGLLSLGRPRPTLLYVIAGFGEHFGRRWVLTAMTVQAGQSLEPTPLKMGFFVIRTA
jgi:hypothetical protein